MKIVVIQVPSILNDAEITEALHVFATCLPIPEGTDDVMQCDIINKKPISHQTNTITSICDQILDLCIDPKNNVATITNFWNNISNRKITKKQLLDLTRQPIVTKVYLHKRNADCFYNLFEAALKHL